VFSFGEDASIGRRHAFRVSQDSIEEQEIDGGHYSYKLSERKAG
jgi:hypothetical protein